MRAEIRHVCGAYEKDKKIVIDVSVTDISTPIYLVRIALKTSSNGHNKALNVAKIQSNRFSHHIGNRNGYIYLEDEAKDNITFPELSVRIGLIPGIPIWDNCFLIELQEIVLEGPEGSPTIRLSPDMALSYPSPSSPSLEDEIRGNA